MVNVGVKRKFQAARYASRVAYKRRRTIRRGLTYGGVLARAYGRAALPAAGLALGAYGAYRAIRGRRRLRRSRVIATKVPRATISRFFIFGSKSQTLVLQSKRIYPALLPMVKEPGPSADDDLHTASKLQYLLKGFKVCAMFRNLLQAPIEVHMMIFQLKDSDPISVNFDAPGDVGKDFFINSTAAVAERHVNFENRIAYTLEDGTVVAASPAWNAEQMCMPINRDKFNVISYKKWRMTSAFPASALGSDNNSHRVGYCKIDKYYPVNKRMAYEKPGDAAVRQPIRVMIWYDTLFDRLDDVGTAGGGTDGLECLINCVGYTKDL